MSLDLCRPFAAHCIGYPVVTLGFGFKSYVGYRIRQRKQREIAKENEFYMQLLQQALPKEEEPPVEIEAAQDTTVTTVSTTAVTANINSKPAQNHHNQKLLNGNGVSTDSSQTNGTSSSSSSSKHHQNHRKSAEKEKQSDSNNFSELDSSSGSAIPNNIANKSTSSTSSSSSKSNNLNYNNLNSVKNNNNNNNSYHQYGNGSNQTTVKDVNLQVGTKCSPFKGKDLEQNNHNNYSSSTSRKECEKDKFIKEETDKVKGYVDQEVLVAAAAPVIETVKERRGKQKESHHNHQQYHQQQTNTHNHDNDKKQHQNCDQCQRMEQEAKKLKSELQSMRGLEADWRGKLDSMKVCLQTKQKENEDVHKQLSVV